MSRIIIQRHENGEEALSAGYDRPMGYFFVDRYDDEGEYVSGIGLLGDGPCESAEAAEVYLLAQEVPAGRARAVRRLLESHVPLEYPESNVCVDLSP